MGCVCIVGFPISVFFVGKVLTLNASIYQNLSMPCVVVVRGGDVLFKSFGAFPCDFSTKSDTMEKYQRAHQTYHDTCALHISYIYGFSFVIIMYTRYTNVCSCGSAAQSLVVKH